MKPYCEIVVDEVLPALRATVAKKLMSSYNMNQSQVSRKLGVSQPAISQYIRKLRGRQNNIIENTHVESQINEICKKIAEGKVNSSNINVEFCSVCKIIRDKKILYSGHNKRYNYN